MENVYYNFLGGIFLCAFLSEQTAKDFFFHIYISISTYMTCDHKDCKTLHLRGCGKVTIGTHALKMRENITKNSSKLIFS